MIIFLARGQQTHKFLNFAPENFVVDLKTDNSSSIFSKYISKIMSSIYSLPDFIRIASNSKSLINENSDPTKIIESYKELFSYLDAHPSSFYFIHDFSRFEYILVSKSIKNILGHDSDLILGKSFGEALPYIHPQDRNRLQLVHKGFFDFFYSQPIEERKKLRFDFNLRFIKKDSNEAVRLLQQTIFIELTTKGDPLYDFSTCTDISIQNKSSVMELMIYKLNIQNVYELVCEYAFPLTSEFGLSKREIEIMKYAALGNSSKEIADKFCISLHTVNTHRKNILAKTQSRSFSEALVKVDLK